MGPVGKSEVTLRISGDDLDPEAITILLGCAPSLGYKKGQILESKKMSGKAIGRTRIWTLKADAREPEDIDAQISELMSKINSTEIEKISKKYRCELFCGLFLNSSNEGIVLSSKSLIELGGKGISLGLDIYSDEEKEEY